MLYHRNGQSVSGIDPLMVVRVSQLKHSPFWRILCKPDTKSSTVHSLWMIWSYKAWHVDLVGDNVVGYVDFGTGLEDA